MVVLDFTGHSQFGITGVFHVQKDKVQKHWYRTMHQAVPVQHQSALDTHICFVLFVGCSDKSNSRGLV